MSEPTDFARLAHAALDATPARDRLDETHNAVVLERTARGGGDTRWYILRRSDDLDALAERVRPGSRVSLYFDGRFSIAPAPDAMHEAVAQIIERDGEAVVGAWLPSDIEAARDFPGSTNELEEFVRDHRDATIFVGAFPAADNDGVNAVTLDLPDADGVVRPHPH